MQVKALEEEVNALSAEMTRLRLMVQQCTESEMRSKHLAAENLRLEAELRASQQEKQQGPPIRAKSATSSHHHPPAVGLLDPLPAMFSGMDGTARLFKAIMEAYPWLVPEEVREAQEIVRQEKELQSEERRQRLQRRLQRQHLELQAEKDSLLEEELRFQQQPLRQATLPVAPISSVSTGPVIHGMPKPVPTSPRQTAATPSVDVPVTPRDGWSNAGEGEGPSGVPSGTSPVQLMPAGPTTRTTNVLGGTGLLIGSRPGSKKPNSLIKKLRQGVASDSDDDAQVDGGAAGVRAITPPVTVNTTAAPKHDGSDDDHDF